MLLVSDVVARDNGTYMNLRCCLGAITGVCGESNSASFHYREPERVCVGMNIDENPQGTEARQPGPKQKRILVVDDDEKMRNLLARVLPSYGYTVDLAEDGETGWRKTQTRTYDCILMDLAMPGISGQQLYQLIKDSDASLARRIVFITGNAARPEVRHFVESTGNPVLRKPFDLEELRRIVLECGESTHEQG